MALEVLETYRAVVGPETAEVARVWHLIGAARLATERRAGAKEANEQALAIRRKALPADHPDIADSLNNLGVVQDEPAGLCGGEDEPRGGAGHPPQGPAQGPPRHRRQPEQPGDVQSELREYAAARKSYEEALAIRRKALPQDHPDIADSLNNLGIVQCDLREYAAARKSHEEALAIRRKALPKDHPDIAQSLNNLGIVQSDLRDYAAARKSHEEALAIRRKALPKDHPDIAESLNNLGHVQCDLREYAAARKSHEEALAIRRKALPKDHPDIAHSLNNLGNVQTTCGTTRRRGRATRRRWPSAARPCPRTTPTSPTA